MVDDLVGLVVNLAGEILEAEGRGGQDLGPDTSLYGKDGLLDSMGIVSLIVAVEQEIEDQFDTLVSLADQSALSSRSSPYRTVQTLAEYAAAAVVAQRS